MSSGSKRQDILLTAFVGALALLPRVIGLSVFLTADEAKAWLGRAMMFARARKGILEEGLPFLPKPTTPVVFLNTVRDILDGK